MKNRFRYIAAFTTLLCTLVLIAGCSKNNASALPDNVLPGLTSVAPEYVTEWPENEYTKHIPQPEHGVMHYVCDYSDAGRYLVALTDLTQEDSGDYVDVLKEQGFTEIHSEGNQVSVGTMLQKDKVALSIAYSDNILTILITADSTA